MTPTISVIITTYNYGRFIAGAIESVLGQTHPADEIIVVDDGSTDDTAQIVAGYAAAGVRYVYQANRGISAAHNLGIRESRGALLAFLDSDDRWLPDKLARQMAHLQQYPQVRLVTGSDVHPTACFCEPVLYLACHGVISGYGDRTFRPVANTTRSEMVKIVVLGFAKTIHTPAGGAHTFAAGPPSFLSFAYIETAAADQIVSGYACWGAGEPCDRQQRPYFRPSASVTRGQLAKIDTVASGWPLIAPPTPGSFEDVLPGSAFYSFVETAACRGMVSVYTCGGPAEPCDPQQRLYCRSGTSATRGQIAKIVYLSITAGGSCPPKGR